MRLQAFRNTSRHLAQISEKSSSSNNGKILCIFARSCSSLEVSRAFVPLRPVVVEQAIRSWPKYVYLASTIASRPTSLAVLES